MVADSVDVAGGPSPARHNDCDTVRTAVPKPRLVRLVEQDTGSGGARPAPGTRRPSPPGGADARGAAEVATQS
jgi:hypothetical protein